MKENQLILIIGAVLSAIILAAPLFAADFEITKVIEVGPADGLPIPNPLLWSPDGLRLAFFHNNWLMISDTLGYTRRIFETSMSPVRCNWLSDNEIALMQVGRITGGRATKLSIVDLVTGTEEILVEKKVKFRDEVEHDLAFIDGPKKSVEGRLYLTKEKSGHKSAEFLKSRYRPEVDTLVTMEYSILRGGDDGIYRVSLTGADSVRLCKKPGDYLPLPLSMSPDGESVMSRGTLIRLSDSTFTILDTAFKSCPKGTKICGITFGNFSTALPEVLFQRSCDDGESYEVLSTWVYNLDTGELTSIDSLAHLVGSNSPCYGPDGITIACLSEGKAYLIKRRVL